MKKLLKRINEMKYWKKWYWYILIFFIILLITIPVCYAYTQVQDEENQLEKEVTKNVQDYLASYVVTDGFVKTLVTDSSLQEQLTEKLNNQTSKLSQEQIDDIVDIAIENFRMISNMSIEELTEEQISALEINIYENIEWLLDEQQEDVEIVANGVTAIVEKNIIKQLENMDASIGALQKEIIDIKSSIFNSQNLEQLNLSLASMVKDIDIVNDRIAEVKTVMNTEDTKLTQDLDTVNSELGNLQIYCDETATVLIKIRAYMDEMNNSSVLSLSQDMLEMYDVLGSAADAIEKLNNKILVIENTIKEVDSKSDISSLKSEIEKIKKNANNMINSINELKKNVEDNKSKTDKLLSELKAEDIAILNKIESLNKIYTTLQNEAKEAINKLTTQMKSLQNATNSAMTNIEEIKVNIEAIKAEIEKLKREKLAVIDVVNSLIVNDNSKALSAAMGYQLELEVDGLREQVAECFQYVSEGKSSLASALADKGITVDANAEFETFATGIEQIGNLGTATPSTILTGYTAYIQNQYVDGEMPYCGDVSINLNAGESFGIPIGYHAGDGQVFAKDLASQTQATANADNMSKEVTSWVNGRKLTGTGADNKEAYNKGYTDGMNDAMNGSNISYTYHKHSGSSSGGGCYGTPIYHIHDSNCYTTVTNRCNCSGYSQGEFLGNHVVAGYPIYRCTNCPHQSTDHSGKCNVSSQSQELSCGKTESTIEYYNLSCGKTDNTIESATIVFP